MKACKRRTWDRGQERRLGEKRQMTGGIQGGGDRGQLTEDRKLEEEKECKEEQVYER